MVTMAAEEEEEGVMEAREEGVELTGAVAHMVVGGSIGGLVEGVVGRGVEGDMGT